jgi:uncharacterized membrane protein
MKAIAELLKHDFKEGSLRLYDSNNNLIYYENSNEYWQKREYDSNGNEIYCEDSNGRWYKSEYDSNNNKIYFESSNGYWSKQEYDSNGNEIYYENSNGTILDNRPKPSCEGKVVEIDGKTYKLVELKQNKKDE